MSRHVVIQSIVLVIILLACPAGVSGQRLDYPSGLAPGTRVVLIDDRPAVAPELRAGRSGTVVCCDADDCTGAVLISWNLWRGGQDEESGCAMAAVGAYPSGSATWIDPSEVRLGLPFDEVGTLEEGPEGCLTLAADDGGVFNLAIDAAFRSQWWVVRPGNYVRVRGLLSTGSIERLCPEQDGDVHHPIISLTNWETSCCDRWVCGFQYGDRVVLVGKDNPSDAVDLPRGATGTIICCRSGQAPSVLVSWDLWANGGDDNAYTECTERLVGLFPLASTWWVAVEDIAREFESDCGTLSEILFCADEECLDTGAVGLFVLSRDVYYLADVVAEEPLPTGRVRAMGLFTPYDELLDGQVVTPKDDTRRDLSGMILDSIIVACPEPSCCEPPYAAGDRVLLTVDAPGGAKGLLAGATGTVVCCNADDPMAPILVSWDGWKGGHSDSGPCDARATWYPENSGWWMTCAELEPLVLPDLLDVDEAFRRFSPETLQAGQEGQAFEVTGVIDNRGGAKSGPFLVDICASDDRELTETDPLIGQVALDIDAGGSATLAWRGPFPTDIPAGTYYIGWRIDPDNAVVERDETNNTALVETAQLTVTGP